MAAPSFLFAQDGALDPAFNPGDVGFGQGDGASGWVEACAMQPDGKALIGGSFGSYDGQGRNKIARLLTSGSIDPSFTTGLGANSSVTSILAQPDGKIIIAGPFTSYNGTNRSRIARLNADGSLDTTFDPGSGASGAIRACALQPDGKIIIGGEFLTYNGTTASRVARLNSDGSLDLTFNAGGSGALGFVYCLALRSDGKVIIAGALSAYNGAVRNKIARLNPDGSLDPSFDPGAGANSLILTCSSQPDGRVLIGGDFTTYAGVPRSRFARLNADGSLDASFDIGTGADNTVKACALQADGRIVVCGGFTAFGTSNSRRIVRLNTNGSVDLTYSPGSGADQEVLACVLQPDGKILVGGTFISFDGNPTTSILRLNSDGTLDLAYHPGSGTNNTVLEVEHLPNGKIMIGGYITGHNGALRMRIARLEADGSVDASFDPGIGPSSIVRAIATQSDGRVIIGGPFGSYGGVPRLGIARINIDGTLDTTFDPGTGAGDVYDIAIQPDGKIIVVGNFTSYNGVARNRIARLNADGSLDTGFNPGSGAVSLVNVVALAADGKILIGGAFQLYNSSVRNRVARLNADGSVDTGFTTGQGANASVLSLAVLPNGKVLIVGNFTSYAGVARNRVAQLNSDGSLDTTFNPGSGAPGTVNACLLQPDGRALVAGSFSSFNAIPVNNIVRIDAAGVIDQTFDTGTGADRSISAIDLDTQGRVLIGGDFLSYSGIGRNRIARLNGTARSRIKVMLEGPFNAGQMNDALRTLPSFPLTEPFTAMGYANAVYMPGASVAASVLSTTGPDAIVDWVIVEMRPAATPSAVAASRAVLLQRDGDIVDLDGVSTVGFAGLAHGNYCMAVKPRTHLPVMLSPTTPLAYGTSTATVDFTSASTLVYDNDARKSISGTMVLATGDATFNEELKYVGNGNDRDPILIRVGGSTPSATLSGYWPEDVNMDGVVKYTGADNDRDPILVNIGGSTPNAVRNAQLP